MLLDRLRIHPIACDRTVITTHWDNPLVHRDPYARLYLVTARTGSLTVDGRRVDLAPGSAYLIPEGAPIRFGRAVAMDHLWFHFRATIDAGVSLFSVWRLPQVVEPAESMVSTALEALEIASRSTPVDGAPVRGAPMPWPPSGMDAGQARFMLATRIRLLLEPFLATARPNDHADELARFAPVFAHVEANLANRVSVPALARLVGLHPTYFAERFRRAVGVPPARYVQTRRLHAAQLLLLGSGEPVKAVADATGFADVAYFCRVFRDWSGMTPSSYRARGRV